MNGDKEKMKEDFNQASDQAKQKADQYKQMAKEKIEHAKEKMRYKREQMKTYVQENPEKSVIIAAVAGLILGSMLAMGGKRKRKWGCKHCG